MKTVFVEREGESRLYGLEKGELFRFPGDRKVYQLITHRTRDCEHSMFVSIGHPNIPIMAADDRAIVIRVVKMNRLSERSQRAFDAMKENMAITGKPGHYKDDLLIHDRGVLAKHDPEVFGWMARDTGTHFIRPNDVYGIFLIAYEMDHVKRRVTTPHDYYWWNGTKLVSVTIDSLRERLNKASCPMARRFDSASYYVKSRNDISATWQEQIDNQLKGLPTKELATY